jgi:lipopolysaccharide transport system permease protein
LLGLFKSAWAYRHFIASSIRAEFAARFARSRFGGLWMVAHPLAQSVIYAVVLSEVMAAKLPGATADKHAYAIYLMSGMLAWSLFAEIVSRCLTLFIDSGNLLKKIVFPRICLPLITAGSALVSNLILLLAMLAVFLALGHRPGAAAAWVLPLTALTLVLGLGVGLLLGILNVFLRDIGQVVPVLLQLGFWLTPIVYLPSTLPEAIQGVMAFNPLAVLVKGYQDGLLFGHTPQAEPLMVIGVAALALLALSLFTFRRAGPEMVDVL